MKVNQDKRVNKKISIIRYRVRKHVDCCVNCGKRTVQSHRIINRRNLTLWMRNYFLANKFNVRKFKWICNKCRIEITKLHKTGELYKQVNTTS